MARMDLGKVVPTKGIDYWTTQDKQDIETDILNEIEIPTKLSDLTDDLGSNPTHTHSQYLTSHQTLKTINNQSLLGSGNIDVDEEYVPYIFDYNFKSRDYEFLSGITETTNGVTVTNGFENKVLISKYISADDVSYYADVTLQDLNTVLCLSSVESGSGIHSSIVTFDFANEVINVYPKSNGSSIPNAVYDTLELTNISGLSYKLEIGRKNRDFYARLTNNCTGKVEEIVIGDESEGALAYKYPVGWLHDYVAFSQISGNSATWNRVYAYLPKRDIVFLGDSITEGYGVAWKKAWVTLVADEIGHDKVLNMGSSGDKIFQCQSIVNTVLAKLKPKIVVVTIGTNGGNTDANVKSLYDSIIAINSYPIFNYIYRGSNSENANSCIEKLKIDGARFDYETSTDYDLAKTKNNAYYQNDGLHLNELGNQAIAQRFLKDCSWIKEFIEKNNISEELEELQEQVEELQEQVDNIVDVMEIFPSALIQHTPFYAGVAISGDNGAEMTKPSTKIWASNRTYLRCVKIRCTDANYKFVVRFYSDENGTFVKGTPSGVRYTEYENTNNYYVKISALRVDGSNITTDDTVALENAIEFVMEENGNYKLKATVSNEEVAYSWESDNKTTTISSSSTDTEYPSAKAVYDYIQSLDGDEVSY